MSARNFSPIWLVLGAIGSVQIGAAFAKQLFSEVSPTGMAWLRLSAAGLILLLARPTFKGLTRKDWITGGALAAFLAGMNWSIYESFARIPLGLAVTFEFLGPLGIALAASRRFRDLVWVILAGIGVVVLGFSPEPLDPVGVIFALVAAACWAGYIFFGSRLSPTWRGTSVLALASAIGFGVLGAPAIISNGTALFQPHILGVALAIGLLSSVIPYSLELRALQLVPTKVYGVLMALEPVAAAGAGIVVLREMLAPSEWAGVVCIVVASIGAVRSQRPRNAQSRPS